jgi:RNA polymerase sigma-70 factor (ECF subfamily)
MKNASDAELAARVRSGRREDFAELVRRHHPAVLSLCRSMLGSEDSAQEAAQEAFLKAYFRLEAFRGESAFPTWVHRIAYNLCIDALRRRSRLEEESLDALLESGGPRLDALLRGREPPGDPAGDADLVDRVLGRLSEDYRLILTLREVLGLDYRELAEAMGCSLDSAKARLRRARAAFREIARHLFKAEGV